MTIPIILAAGSSARMGQSKALLRIGKESFIRRIAELYRVTSFRTVVVVTRPNATEIRQELDGMGCTFVENKNFAEGQLSSIIAGLGEVEALGGTAAILHPVDHPVVTADVIKDLVAAFDRNRSLIIVPRFEGKRGHPIIVSSKLFREFKEARPDIGGREVVWRHSTDLTEVDVEDQGILIDIDTPQNYDDLQRNL